MTEQVGRYTILGQLGRGGMGVVYLAEDPLLNRQVAIKTLDLVLENPAERAFMLERLLRDARAAAMLSHPNIVCVYDVLVEGNSAYLVMEYVAGDSLAKRLGVGMKPDLAFSVEVLREVAAALDYTHGRGVIHRDVKPANVMITTAGAAKIMDFGIARITDTRTSTPTGMVMGTAEYMAPEQIKGEALDGRADQFSLAAMAYQMLTGASVFGPHTLATLTYKIVNETPPPASSRNAMLPATVDSVLAKALSKLPQERFSSCAEFAAALESAVAGDLPNVTSVKTAPIQAVIETTPAAAPPISIVPKKSRLLSWPAVAFVCVLIAGAAVVAWFLKSTATPPQTVASVPAAAAPANPRRTAKQQSSMQGSGRTSVTPAIAKPPAQKEVPSAEDAAEPPPGPADEQGKYLQLNAGSHPPDPARALLLKGQAFMRAGKFSEAVQSLSQAIQMASDYPLASMERGIAYMNEDQPGPAIGDFSRVIQQRPRFANAYNERAICYVRLHNDKEAIADFSTAIELNPNLPAPLNGRGLAHMRRGGYHKAVADFDAAIRISPAFVAAYQNRARAKAALGDDAGAKADREAAHRLIAQNGASGPGK